MRSGVTEPSSSRQRVEDTSCLVPGRFAATGQYILDSGKNISFSNYYYTHRNQGAASKSNLKLTPKLRILVVRAMGQG